MSLGILGKKIGMTQLFDTDGNRVSVTIVESGPCQITQIKTKDRDGYNAVQLGFDEKREKVTRKPNLGHFKKAGSAPKRFVREFRVDDSELESLKVGQEIKLENFQPKDAIDVVGTSKGRGFAGVMKRYNFAGAPATHGTHEAFRHGGSIGCAFPQHVIKGRKMPGHMGVERVTVQNLEVFAIRPEENLLYIKGSVPGHRHGYLMVQKAKKA